MDYFKASGNFTIFLQPQPITKTMFLAKTFQSVILISLAYFIFKISIQGAKFCVEKML